MKSISLFIFITMFCLGGYTQTTQATTQPTSKPSKKNAIINGYQIGDKAEDFELRNVDDNMVSLSKMKNTKGYIIVFTSNECPFALAYEDRLIQLHNEMAPRGYPVVAINANEESQDGGNSFEDMKKRAKEKQFPFVYLKDAKQNIFPKFGATKTPHVFLLDKEMTVRYIGAIDDNSRAPEEVKERYVMNAIAALENGQSPNPEFTKAIGCPISSKGAKAGVSGPRGHRGPPSPDKILEMMDKNNDQKVSKDEVHGPLGRDFDRLDTNKDGLLTKEELAKLKKRG